MIVQVGNYSLFSNENSIRGIRPPLGISQAMDSRKPAEVMSAAMVVLRKGMDNGQLGGICTDIRTTN